MRGDNNLGYILIGIFIIGMILGLVIGLKISFKYSIGEKEQVNISNFTETLDWFQTTQCKGTFFVKQQAEWTAFEQTCLEGGYCKYDNIPIEKCEVRP